MTKLLTVAFFLIFSSLGASTAVPAQVRSCDLRVNPYELLKNSNPGTGLNGRTIGETNASISSNFRARLRKSQLIERTPYFRSVAEGEYKLVVAKNGFETLRRVIEVDCTKVDSLGRFCIQVILSRLSSSSSAPTLPESEFPIIASTGPEDPNYRCGTLPQALPAGNLFRTRIVDGGVLNFKAIGLPKPAYPVSAMASGLTGSVTVKVLVDETGKVVEAVALSGPRMFRRPAEQAAKQARFNPISARGVPLKMSGIITYSFVSQL